MIFSKVRSGIDYRLRFKGDKCEYCLRLIKASLLVFFFLVNIVLVSFTYKNIISMHALAIEMSCSVLLIILVFNIHQFVVYYKSAGHPYKHIKYYKNVRQLSVVCFIWTLSFAFKFGCSALGVDLIDI
jgi:hypothetical protein